MKLKTTIILGLSAGVGLLLVFWLAGTRTNTPMHTASPTDTGDMEPSLAANGRDTRNFNSPPQRSRHLNPSSAAERPSTGTVAGIDTASTDQERVSRYIAAWRSKEAAAALWDEISHCDRCLEYLVELIKSGTLEKGLTLELSYKLMATESDRILPMFDYLLDPVNDRSTAIIVLEQAVKNGNPLYIEKILESLHTAQLNGYKPFARQLTWVITKIKNPAAIQPVLDIVSGRKSYASDFTGHIAAILGRSVTIIPDQQAVNAILTDYYLHANEEERTLLWDTVCRQSATLANLAITAYRSGDTYQVEHYVKALAQTAGEDAIDAIVRVARHTDYAQEYFIPIMRQAVLTRNDNKILRRLEFYLKDANLPLRLRVIAAEGLLVVQQKKTAQTIISSLVQSRRYQDAELIAYLKGRS